MAKPYEIFFLKGAIGNVLENTLGTWGIFGKLMGTHWEQEIKPASLPLTPNKRKPKEKM
jgi:hypothetical protein